MQLVRWVCCSILSLSFLGCGSSYNLVRAFVSDKNRCFPDYVKIPVPTLLDPSAQSLSVVSIDTPTYAQSFNVTDSHWSYGIQLRLVLGTSNPDAKIDLYKVGNDGSEVYSSKTLTLPNESIGTFVGEAEFDLESVTSAESWMDFPFAIPQYLSSEHSYWALVTVRSQGMFWTVVQGSNFSRYDSGWTVATDRQGTIRSVGCEAL